jgi:hypothetical protein
MATVRQVYELLRQGKTSPDILQELHITPSRLKKIIGSKRIWKIDLLERDVVPLVTKMVALEKALPTFIRLQQIARKKGDLGRRACEALLEQLNLNFPPAARRMPRKGYWD